MAVGKRAHIGATSREFCPCHHTQWSAVRTLSAVHYLSDEWFAAADNAVRAAADSAPKTNVVVHQVMTNGRSYRIRVGRGQCSIEPMTDDDSLEQADASFTQSLETATAVATGRTDAHQAFLLGRIRFEGEAHVLIDLSLIHI